MRFSRPTRFGLTAATVALCLAFPAWTQASRLQTAPPDQAAAPIERKPKPPIKPNFSPAKPNGEHLAEWMNRHSNLTPEQQQKALESEPGFKDLPPQTQQRMREHLAELNAMPPAQRQRLLEHNEWMEHLSPPQQKQVRAAMKQLADLPPDQRRYVARTFRGLRELPPAQRQAVLNSERFAHLTDAQRASLNSLMQVEPLLPPPYDATAPGNDVAAH